jgi:ribosomal protein L17
MFAVICGDYKAWKKAKGQPTSNTLHSLFTVNQETTVAKKVDPRRKMVDEIIANCECQNEDDDRAVLNELSDDELKWTHEFVSNMAAGGGTTNNGMSVGKIAQKRLLNEMADEELEEEYKNRKKAKNAAARAAKKNQQPPPEDDEEEEEDEPVGNAKSLETAKITVNDLPPDMREDIEYARAMKQRERDSIIDRLTANVADPKAKATQRKRLQSRSLSDLRADVELLPVANEEDGDDLGAPIYAGPGPVINQTRPAPQKPEPLGQPQWDWDQPARTRAG